MCGGHGAFPAAVARCGRLSVVVVVASLIAGGGPVFASEPDEGDGADDDAARGDAPPRTVDEAVTVTAARAPPPGVTSSVALDPHDASLPAAATVADLLGRVAGLAIRRLGGPADPAYVRIRGSTARQVEVWLDGIPLNPGGSSTVDLADLDLDGIDEVVVHRGTAPPELGGAPIGGVVALRTSPNQPAPLRLAGTFGSFRSGAASVRGGSRADLDGGTVSMRGSLRFDGTAGDFRFFDPNGTIYDSADDSVRKRENNDSARLTGTGSIAFERGPLRIAALERLLWSDGGVPLDGATSARVGTLDNVAGISLRASARPELDVAADMSLRLRRETFLDPEGEVGLGIEDEHDRFDTTHLGLLARFAPRPFLLVTPSLRLTLDGYTPWSRLRDPASDGRRARALFAPALATVLHTPDQRLELFSAVEVAVVDDRFLGDIPFSDEPLVSAGRETRVEVLPRVAFAATPTAPIGLRAGIARGFRPPGFDELFGDRGGVVGNATLRPETAWNIDGSVSARGAWGDRVAASFEVGAFLSFVRDAIVLVPNGQRVAVPINLGSTRTGGAELAVTAYLLRRVELRTALTLTDARIVGGEAGTVGNRVPSVPPVAWSVDGMVRIDPWVRAGVGFALLSRTFETAANLFAQPDRLTLSIRLRLRPHARGPFIEIDVENLTDRISVLVPRDPLHPDGADRTRLPVQDFRGNPLPGRAIYVTMGGELR